MSITDSTTSNVTGSMIRPVLEESLYGSSSTYGSQVYINGGYAYQGIRDDEDAWTCIRRQRIADSTQNGEVIAQRRAEQRRAREEHQRWVQERYAERLQVVDRSRQLLVAHLDEEQRASFEDNGYFYVEGSEGGVYMIDGGSVAGNVHRMIDGRPAEELCAHLSDVLPRHDHHLAQKLMLESNEPLFRDIANITVWRGGPLDETNPTVRP